MRSLLNFRILFLVAVLALLLGVKVPHIQAAVGDVPLRGYAWSDNVGWLSFSCENTSYCATSNYGVFIDAAGSLFGNAWSDNVGWVSFNTADLTGCPSGTCEARYNSGSGTLSGWARALAYKDPENGGWDGWISLSGTGYGVTVNRNTGDLANYAWSDMVMGWLSFNCANTGTCGTSPYKVYAMFSNASVVELKGNGSVGSMTITQGQSATISWNMQNVTNPVPSSSPADSSWNSTTITLPSGSKVVTPAVTTTYTITATSPSGPVTSSVTVTVVPVGGAATLTISPLNAQTTIGGTQQFLASYDQDGAGTTYAPIDVTASANWISTVMTVATVNPGGVATGVAAGNTTIRATYGGISAGTSLMVVSNNAPSLTISPSSVNLAIGGTQQFTAVYDPDGSSGPIAPYDVTANTSWSSSNPSVTSVNTSGLATALSNGTVTVGATYNGLTMVTNGASVYVTPTGGEQSTLTGNSSQGTVSILPGHSVTLVWNLVNVTSCTPSSDPADAAWNGTTITLPSGSQTLNPSQSTTYSLNCSGPGGSSVISLIVNVTAPYFNLNAAPSSVPITFAKGVKEVCSDNVSPVKITVNDLGTGYNKDVSLSVSASDWGGLHYNSFKFSPSSSLNKSQYQTGSDFNVCIPNTVTQGVYNVLVTGTGIDGKTDKVGVLFNVLMASPTWQEI